MTDRILLVEDDVTVRNVVEFMLALEGYEVVLARNGGEGLEAASRQIPDLIILDVQMPGMSGIEMANLLKSDERTKGVPIVMLSGLDEDEAIWKGYRVGAHSYVTKPFGQEELLSVVNRVIGQTQDLSLLEGARQ